MSREHIKIGDRITFTVTTRGGRRKATRKVTGFAMVEGQEWPQVTYAGWSGFVVGWATGDIIHGVERAA